MLKITIILKFILLPLKKYMETLTSIDILSKKLKYLKINERKIIQDKMYTTCVATNPKLPKLPKCILPQIFVLWLK